MCSESDDVQFLAWGAATASSKRDGEKLKRTGRGPATLSVRLSPQPIPAPNGLSHESLYTFDASQNIELMATFCARARGLEESRSHRGGPSLPEVCQLFA